jgi:hypothetical protein
MASRQTQIDKILNEKANAFAAYPFDTMFPAEAIVRLLRGIQKEAVDVRKRTRQGNRQAR